MQFVLTCIAAVSAAFILLNCLTQVLLAWKALRRKANPSLQQQANVQLPSILVQLPIYNEQHVVERLLHAVSALDYPRGKLVIQLLDDSTDITTHIAARVIAQLNHSGAHPIEHIRRDHREGFKAGALSYGMKLATGELIAIFDADFLPQPDFLRRVAPQFADPSVGLVQTRWAHTNASYNMLTRLMSLVIDNHFAVEHAGKLEAGAFINFNGTAGIWRRATIEQAGGWSADCLTEDLDLSFRAQFAGWKFRYLDEIETAAELPAILSDLKSQQFRWTKGAVETGRKLLVSLWRCPAPLPAKLIGTLQLTNGFLFPASLLVSLCLLAIHFTGQIVYPAVLMAICLALALSTLATTFALVSAQWIRGKRSWWQVTKAFVEAQLFIVFSTGFGVHNSLAVADGLAGRKSEFVRTAKHALNSSQRRKLAGDRKPLPKTAYLECLLAFGFLFAAVTEMLPHYSHSISLVSVMVVFGLGYTLMASIELYDRFAPSLVLGEQALAIEQAE